MKSCAAIEFLAEAGAELKGTDEEGNTAIILVASSSYNDQQVPTKEDSPNLFKVTNLEFHH